MEDPKGNPVADFAACLRALVPGCDGGETTGMAPHILRQLAHASAVLAPMERELSGLSDDELVATLLNHSGAANSPPKTLRHSHPGEGCGEADSGDFSAPPNLPFTSPSKQELEAADSVALRTIQQIGCLETLLLEPRAFCDECHTAIPCVVDVCRVLSGDRLCSRCDINRHMYG